MQITAYDSTTNDRFDSGYPTAPINNTALSFIGIDNDWSGVAWSSSNSKKSFPFLSPGHYLIARHFSGASFIRTFDQTGNLQTKSQQSVENIGYGIDINAGPDLSIGTLTASMQDVARYAVLDLNTSSTSNSNSYANLNLLIYGHGGTTTNSTRIESALFQYNPAFGGFSNDGEYFLTSRIGPELEDQDSGSPVFADWTNPNGVPELALIGNNAAISTNYNLHSFLGTHQIMTALHSFMNDDGRALRVVGNSSSTWDGSPFTFIGSGSSWSSNSVPTDKYVKFNPGSTAANKRIVNVSSNQTLRGLYFTSSEPTGDTFTFTGNSTLTIGRGGITNYDNDTQTFASDLALGSPQYWSIESGALSLTTLNNNGHLLEIGGSGSTIVSGNISGNGGLALSEGTLTLNGTSSYTGTTWVHSGNLDVSGDISSSASLTLGTYGQLSGTGSTPQLNGEGSVSPGNSSGILTVKSINPSEGLDFDFEFTATGAPDFRNPASSLNDLVHLTDSTPIAVNMDASNRIRIFLNVGALNNGQIFKGGFFTDVASDFLTAITNAEIEIYTADVSGAVSFNGQAYSPHDGPYLFALTTEPQDADFGAGTISGQIMQLSVAPDLTDYEGWKINYGLSGNAAQDSADDDADGIPLLLEFALGGQPNENTNSPLPTIRLTTEAGSDYLELSLTRPQALQNLVYSPKTTTDLGNWPINSSGILDTSPTPADNGDGTETLVYRRSQAVSTNSKAFIRIDVSETSP